MERWFRPSIMPASSPHTSPSFLVPRPPGQKKPGLICIRIGPAVARCHFGASCFRCAHHTRTWPFLIRGEAPESTQPLDSRAPLFVLWGGPLAQLFALKQGKLCGICSGVGTLGNVWNMGPPRYHAALAWRLPRHPARALLRSARVPSFAIYPTFK